MAERRNFRKGMQVYSSDNHLLGTIDEVHGDGFHLGGQHYAGSSVARMDQERVYLTGNRQQYLAGSTTGRETEGSIRVPVVEERLNVEKRQTELGEVGIRKEVTQEQVQVPVELRREEVTVERVDVPDRPVRPGDLDNAFQEGTIRVPVRGEQAIVEKEAVVTGEVVINKQQTTERQTISDTVRKEHVNVDENWRQARTGFEEHFNTRTRQAGGTTTNTRRFQSFQEAEPHYRHGFQAGFNQNYRGKNWNEVESSLRRDWESNYGSSGSTAQATTAGTGTTSRTTTTSSSTTSGTGSSGGFGGRTWEDVREEVQEGFTRASRS